MVIIKSAARVAEEEALLEKAQLACKEQPRTSDDTDYLNSTKQLHDKGIEIRTYINNKYPDYCELHPALKTFRGSYGYSTYPESQEVQLVMNLVKETGDTYLTMALLEIQEINTEMLYEAEKLCIKNPRPFYKAWEDELGPYEASVAATTES